MLSRIVSLIRPSMTRRFSVRHGIEKNFNDSKTNSYLLQLYNNKNLSLEERLLMLRFVIERMQKVKEIDTVFNTSIGNQYINQLIKDSKNLPPDQNYLILKFLSKPYKNLLLKVVAMEDVRFIIKNISNDINPTEFPLETINAYRDSANLGVMNHTLETKALKALDSLKTISFEPLLLSLEGAIKLPRLVSIDVINRVVILCKNFKFENLNQMIMIWTNIGIAKFYFHVGEEFFDELTEKICESRGEISMKISTYIVEYFVLTQTIDRKIMEKVFAQINQNINDTFYFTGDSVEKLVIGLYQLNQLKIDTFMDQETGLRLIDLVCVLNDIGRIKDSETIVTLKILYSFTKTLPENTKDYLIRRLQSNDANLYLNLCISAFLAHCNVSKIDKIFEENCNTLIKDPNYTFSALMVVYGLLESSPGLKNIDSVKTFMNYFENRFSASITDFHSFRYYYKIARDNKDFVVNTRLWELYTFSAIRALAPELKSSELSIERILEYFIFLYNPNLASYKLWKEVALQNISKLRTQTMINLVFDKFDINSVPAYLDLVTMKEDTFHFVMGHLMSMRIQNPTNSLLLKACSALEKYSDTFLNDERMKLSEDSLFSQIFLKGYSKFIPVFLKKFKFINCMSSDNLKLISKLMILLTQYSQISQDSVKFLKLIKSQQFEKNVHFNIAILTIFPEEKYEKYLPEFFELSDDVKTGYLMEKINLFLNLSKGYPNDSKFLEKALFILSERCQKNTEDLINCLTLLTRSFKNNYANEKIQRLLEECFVTRKIHEFSTNELTKILICFVKLNFNPQIIELIEEKLQDSVIDGDLNEGLINFYKRNRRNNAFIVNCILNSTKLQNENSFDI